MHHHHRKHKCCPLDIKILRWLIPRIPTPPDQYNGSTSVHPPVVWPFPLSSMQITPPASQNHLPRSDQHDELFRQRDLFEETVGDSYVFCGYVGRSTVRRRITRLPRWTWVCSCLRHVSACWGLEERGIRWRGAAGRRGCGRQVRGTDDRAARVAYSAGHAMRVARANDV